MLFTGGLSWISIDNIYNIREHSWTTISQPT